MPWHHAVYDDIDHWDDEKCMEVYYRLSMDLRLGERSGDDMEHVTRMIEVETELAERGIDPMPIARQVEMDMHGDA